ncbi:hypothetical protein LJC52_02165 [Bacteroidales bacterium OttesenSCG-928-A17]|nr:hypothetical protein [Bacteroidales bacterium OttesenSCG-928-A17]
MQKYFENEQVNQAINSWSAYPPKQGGYNDLDWYNLIVLFCENNISVNLDFFKKVNEIEEWDLEEDTISELFKRYEDLRDFYKFLNPKESES